MELHILSDPVIEEGIEATDAALKRLDEVQLIS